jgi:transcriptional regulator with XRE-family HTH domain
MNTNKNLMREMRAALGISQKELADRLQVSLMTVRRCEYNARLPGTIAARAAIARMARELGMSLPSATTLQPALFASPDASEEEIAELVREMHARHAAEKNNAPKVATSER